MIPGLPEMVESMKPKFPKEQERQVNDYSSGIFNSFLGFGQVLAPMYGSTVTEALGFRWTTDIVAIICFVFGIIYFVFGDGIEAFRTTCSNIKNRDKIAEKMAIMSETSSVKSHFTNTSRAALRVPKLHSFAVQKIQIANVSNDWDSACGRNRINSHAWADVTADFEPAKINQSPQPRLSFAGEDRKTLTQTKTL